MDTAADRATPQPRRAAYLSARQAAERSGYSEKTLRRWIAAGKLRADRDGQGFRIDPAELDALIGHAADGAAAPDTDTTDRTRRGAALSGHAAANGHGHRGAVPSDMTLVPREAWVRAMDQLGHFHELAENYARTAAEAAKAQTESAFLRERLGELRDELERTRAELIKLQTPPESVAAPPAGAIFRPLPAEPEPPRRPWWRFW